MNATDAGTEKTLLQIVEAMAAGAPEEGYTLRETFDQLDESAFGAGLFLLALPCCIPVITSYSIHYTKLYDATQHGLR